MFVSEIRMVETYKIEEEVKPWCCQAAYNGQ